MRNFNPGSRPRGRNDSFRRNSGGRDSERPPLHDAVCDECGKDCQVPFRPSGDRPIYCSDCFETKGGRDRDSNRSGRRDFGRRNFDNRDSGRSPRNNSGDHGTSQLAEKIGTLNTKLDTIISLLSSVEEKRRGSIKTKTEKKKESQPKTETKAKPKKKSQKPAPKS